MRVIFLLKWVFIIGICYAGSNVCAPENQLVFFLNEIVERHPYFQQTALDSSLAREIQKEMLGGQDYFFLAKTNITHEKTASYDPFSPKSLTGSVFSAGLTKKDWKTGGQISLNWQFDWLHQQLTDLARQFMIPRNNYQQSLTATYSIPLMKNRKGILDRLQFELQSFEIEKAKLNLKENQENFLEEAAGKYLECALLKEQLAITQKEEELQRQLLAYVKRRVKARLADSTETISTYLALLRVQQTREQLEGEYRATAQQLAVRYNYPQLLTQPPQFDIYKIPSIPQNMAEYTIQSRPLRFIKMEMERLNFLRASLKNAELPELNLTLTAGVQKNHSKIKRSIVPNKPNLAVGLEFGLPVQNRAAQSRRLQAEIQKKQTILSLQSLQTALQSEGQHLLLQYENFRKGIESDRVRYQNARKKALMEEERYKKGLQTIDFVLMSRLEAVSVQHELLQKHYQLYLLWLRYMNLSDRLYDFGGKE